MECVWPHVRVEESVKQVPELCITYEQCLRMAAYLRVAWSDPQPHPVTFQTHEHFGMRS